MTETSSGPEEVDLLVIGGGKAGKTLAVARAKAGERVAMVERGMIGGSCINVACIPTKTLVTSARALATFARAEKLGIRSSSAAVDLALLRAHKEGVVGDMVDMHRTLFAGSGMDFILGSARFTGPRTVEVATDAGGTRTLRGRRVVLNTGTRPSIPRIPGLSREQLKTSEDMLRLEGIPERLVVVGGGYVGCEFAQMFARFGSAVTMIVRGPRLLAREEPEVSEAIERAFAEDGITVLHDAAIEHGRAVSGGLALTLSTGGELRADAVLVAVGREPVTDGLDVQLAGVELDERGYVVVDDELRTSADRVWAVGDVAGHPQFTHVSYDDFRIVQQNLDLASDSPGHASTRGRLVPSVVFVEPEIANVGLSEAEAREAGHDVVVASQPVLAVPRSRTLRQTDGFWKIVIDRDSTRILGATLVGADSAEVLSVIQTAMLADAPYTLLRDAIFAHPAMAEGLATAFANVKFR
ncbi:dihydrolipoyl dehydrogenase family protein [Microterricola viridarii]|uniref:Mercuric reductase n=1 Tax=Microterricola viridarii TaxID=412690 RepID=A0A0Y0MCI1_9MICO|nr:FAD-dependent oxidoreductase [Microterricola viridarii]AMB57811.1 mercuric reductase [Microterricola viridarii]